MEKIELKKLYKDYYSPKPGKPEIITMPVMQFAMVDGKGDPNNSEEFQEAIKSLYNIVYGLKFSRKKAGKTPDFNIGALEGLWWTNGKKFEIGKKGDWLWTLMIWVPDFIEFTEFNELLSKLKTRKPELVLENVRLEKFNEGIVVQIMHIGPYGEEQADVDKMHAFALEQGYTQSGKHHEIYFGDPRRTKPEKLKTILRHPIKKRNK